AMGKNPDDFIVLLIQLVNLLRDGKTVNMSTRSGEFVTLSEVLDETGTDAARFLFLTRRSDSPLDFDLEIAKRQTNENPVYYVQYAHARISGVMREFAKLNKDFPDNNKIPEEIFDDKNTRELADILTFYPDEISQASNDLTPHILTGYILNVAGAFHSFYNTNRIIDEPEGKLNLSMAAKNVIASCLNLLGVNAPERM
ncbi:MAG: arginine--tRNA ligase, partial [Synergistaceae bacterium]|nr:arginine--tRNA ligase [Synergistaceae bacterium]